MNKTLSHFFTMCAIFIGAYQSVWANAENIIHIGFVVETDGAITIEEQNKVSAQLIKAIDESNERTYKPLNIRLEYSFELFEETHIQRHGLTSSGILKQARFHTESITSILDDTTTDVVFYIFPTLSNACGSAEIPHLLEHFNYRFLVGAIKSTCLNSDVLSHEVGHLFGAHHDEENDTNTHIITNTARGCILDKTSNMQGSLMSYASKRTASFSTPEYCGDTAYNNEQLIIEKAPLLASMYERFSEKTLGASLASTGITLTAGENDDQAGGHSDYPLLLLSILFIVLRQLTLRYLN